MGAMGVNYPRVSPSVARSVSELNHRLKLVTMDEKETEIAKFHRAHHFTKKRKARLEVQPAGMGMLDHIVLTFLIVEHIRRGRELGVSPAAGASYLY